jgi:hypothetical protein
MTSGGPTTVIVSPERTGCPIRKSLPTGALFRHPKLMCDLFTSLSTAENWCDFAWIGYYDGEAGLAKGFAEASETIFIAWKIGPRSNGTDDMPGAAG